MLILQDTQSDDFGGKFRSWINRRQYNGVTDFPYGPDEPILDPDVSITSSTYVQKQGLRTSGYKKLLKAGMLPANPYSYSKEVITYPAGFLERIVIRGDQQTDTKYTYAGQSVHNNFGVDQNWGYPIPSASTILATESAARASFLEKLKDQKVNVAQVLGEKKQTIEMIASTAIKLASMLKNIKNGNLLAAAKDLGAHVSRKDKRGHARTLKHQGPADAAAEAWLAVQYGVRPLLQDIYGAAEQFADGTRSNQDVRVSSRKSITQEDVQVHHGIGIQPSCKVTKRLKYTVKYTCTYRVTMALTALSTRLGLQNPAQLAWELLPFSFVVDWMYPVGNFLSSLDASGGLSFGTGTRTVIMERSITEEWFFPDANRYMLSGYTLIKQRGGMRASQKWITVNREVITEFPKPIIPRVKNPFSVEHALNALALLRVTTRKR